MRKYGNFIFLTWKPDNPYYHSTQKGPWRTPTAYHKMQEPGLKNLDEISNTRGVEWGKTFLDLFLKKCPFELRNGSRISIKCDLNRKQVITPTAYHKMQEPGLKNLDEISNTRVEWGKSFSDLFLKKCPFHLRNGLRISIKSNLNRIE